MKATFKGLKYNIKFILESRKDKDTGEKITENVPIIMSVTFGGKRLFHNIGFKTDLNYWEEGELYSYQRKNTTNKDDISAAIINAVIRNHASAVDKVFARFEKYPTVPQLREQLKKELNKSERQFIKEKTVFDYFDDYIKNKSEIVSNWRIKQLKSSKNHLKNFVDEYGLKLTLNNITNITISDFEKYLKTDAEQPRSQNTISSILNKIKAFFNYANQRGWTTNNPFVKYKIEKEVYGDPIFLTKKELDSIYSREITNERLSRVRDIFCLQCYLGARIGDYVHLRHENIIDGVLHYVPSKTADDKATVCKIPLTKRALSIINKYDIPGGDLVPYISGQKYNEYLKELFRLCEINRKVARLNPVMRKTEIVKLSDIASSHMARRTFIGILFKHTKNEVIASMSGHVQGSRAFRRYYGITHDDREDAIKNLE
jgi:site-specific recombinase XerD